MRGVGDAVRVPLLGWRVTLDAAGVRILATIVLLASAGLVAALAASALPQGREPYGAPVMLALSLLAIVATVPALLDGRLRFAIAGVASLLLGIVAAFAAGLGASPLATGLAWLVVVCTGVTAVYHLLGAGREPRQR